jgi:hypothetical protein
VKHERNKDRNRRFSSDYYQYHFGETSNLAHVFWYYCIGYNTSPAATRQTVAKKWFQEEKQILRVQYVPVFNREAVVLIVSTKTSKSTPPASIAISMINSTITTNFSIPDNWADLYQLDQPLDMEAFLKSDILAARRSVYMEESIGLMVTGSISFIASLLLVMHILRSHNCLSTTHHRLIFGLSAADIIASFATSLSSTMDC